MRRHTEDCVILKTYIYIYLYNRLFLFENIKNICTALFCIWTALQCAWSHSRRLYRSAGCFISNAVGHCKKKKRRKLSFFYYLCSLNDHLKLACVCSTVLHVKYFNNLPACAWDTRSKNSLKECSGKTLMSDWGRLNTNLCDIKQHFLISTELDINVTFYS